MHFFKVGGNIVFNGIGKQKKDEAEITNIRCCAHVTKLYVKLRIFALDFFGNPQKNNEKKKNEPRLFLAHPSQ